MVLTALYRYPVKSLRGECHSRLDVGRRGLLGDRDWMVVDEAGRFVTQRQQPQMALISATRLDGDSLRLSAPGCEPIFVPDAPGPPRVDVKVWRDTLTADEAAPEASAWLSEFLRCAVRLVRFPDDVERLVDPEFADDADRVGFADGFPFLLISQGSLDHLNARLAEPVPMQRFRPNLVVDGCDAHAEDGWSRLRIGDIEFRVAKPCSRCIIPTIDIETGNRSQEPLQSLAAYRKRDNKIFFGQNLLHDGSGSLEVGMPVEVLA